MKTVTLPQQIYDAIKVHALHTAPAEACGMIAAEYGEPVAVYLACNVAENPYQNFQVDPQQQQSFLASLAEAGMELWGVYHSHPRDNSHPGRQDILSARSWPQLVHIIVGMAEGLTMRAWMVDPYVRQLELVIK